MFTGCAYEQQYALENQSADNVLTLLDYPKYFELTQRSLPANKERILEQLAQEKLITKNQQGTWNIYNLGAILFAKNLNDFNNLSRKSVRLILYKGNNRIYHEREILGGKGYAVGFESLIDYLTALLPANEILSSAIRQDLPMYPDLALRELIANMLIHQDFTLGGTGPMIEIFNDRMEITNPGTPLIDIQRFIDSPPQSRNERLASFMRRIGICEERGSGIDKVIHQIEVFQLPPPLFEHTEKHLKVTLYAHKSLSMMEEQDKIRACYQHCCLKYVSNEHMNNASLRERFKIKEGNSSMASRIIKKTTEAQLIRLFDGKANRKHYRYVPFWA